MWVSCSVPCALAHIFTSSCVCLQRKLVESSLSIANRVQVWVSFRSGMKSVQLQFSFRRILVLQRVGKMMEEKNVTNERNRKGGGWKSCLTKVKTDLCSKHQLKTMPFDLTLLWEWTEESKKGEKRGEWRLNWEVKQLEGKWERNKRDRKTDRVMPVSPPLSKSNVAGSSGNMQMRCKCVESLEEGCFLYWRCHGNAQWHTHAQKYAGMGLDRWIGQRMKKRGRMDG